MRELFAKNISRYRKEKNLTQEEFSNLLGISFQAISKWERGQSMPDIILLPEISKVLEISLDKLFGYPYYEKEITIYERQYDIEKYYWGVVPSRKCLKILDLFPPTHKIKLLDIGCGEGKDAVFFARNGYEVTAFDISEAGLRKAEKLAINIGVNINIFKANVLDFRLSERYDILYSNGVFHYIKPDLRYEIIKNYKEFTNINGINVFSVFVRKPFIEVAPDHESSSYDWNTGEIFTHYNDWYIEKLEEVIFDCNSSNAPHKHAVNNIISRKI